MRTPVSRIEVATGAFLSSVTLLLVVALIASARRTNLLDIFRQGFLVTAVSESAYGAAVGSPVKVRDVEVGSVTEVVLDGTTPAKPVRIRMRIQPRASAFLAEGTVAHIVQPPLGSGMPPFGTSSIELRTEGSRPLLAGATISAEGEESMIGTFAKMRGDVFAIRERMIQTLDDLGGTLGNMRTLTDSLTHGKGFAGKMLNDGETADKLGAMLDDARAATGDLRKIATDMKVASAQAPALLKDVHEDSEEAKKLMARVSSVLDAVPRIIATAERTLAATEELTENLRQASSTAPELARKVDVSLEEANRLVEAAQRNFLLRSTLPDRPTLRTESGVRPPAFAADGGAP